MAAIPKLLVESPRVAPTLSRYSPDLVNHSRRSAEPISFGFARRRPDRIGRSRRRRVPPPSPSVYPSPMLPEEEKDPMHAAVDFRLDGQKQPTLSASPIVTHRSPIQPMNLIRPLWIQRS